MYRKNKSFLHAIKLQTYRIRIPAAVTDQAFIIITTIGLRAYLAEPILSF
jgi:hypothetical protein